jgi:enolase
VRFSLRRFSKTNFSILEKSTIEVDEITENGVLGRAAVPSGASTGGNTKQ